MRFRTLISSTVAAGIMAFAATSYADNIAYVNVQDIMNKSSAGKSIKEQLEAKQKTFRSEVGKKEESLQKMGQELSKEQSVLSASAFDKKVKAFHAKETEAQKDAQEKGFVLENAKQTSLTELQKAVFDIVSKISKDKGYSAVLPNTALLYADSKLDITNEVLDQLDKNLPKVTVKFKSPSSLNAE
ncbi:MAG TPA: OmpH family outer membrane protein [Rickettsiales bacterium]|nr:OmpH family outer membrane protein [Rickettsiales bacterium]